MITAMIILTIVGIIILVCIIAGILGTAAQAAAEIDWLTVAVWIIGGGAFFWVLHLLQKT